MYLPIYLLAIIVVMINSLFIRKDSMYIPKLQKRKVSKRIRKYNEWIMTKLTKVLEWTVDILVRYVLTTKPRKRNRRRISRTKTRYHLMAISATAMRAEARIKSNTTTFASDSAMIGIDNHCSACISHIPEDFV